MAEVVLRDVLKVYGDFVAVDELNLSVKDGEFVSLVGPSGCGKTTTLNLIAGLVDLDDGEIRIDDRVVDDLDPKDRDIAMVFQNYALYPNKTVFKNLAFPLQMRRFARADIDRKVREAAKLLDIEHLLERRPRELSGGQQQRVALGRALVRDPLVFLMDEPLSNLDAKLRVQMRAELKRFHQDLKATVIYVTHDQLEAMTMSDRIAIMNGGVLQQFDTPDKVFAEPANTFVAGFVGSPSMNLLACTLNGRGVDGRGWTMTLDDALARRAGAASTAELVLGARHSAIGLHMQPQPDALRARVYTVEPTGDITYVHLFLGQETMIASTLPGTPIAADDEVWVSFDQSRLHLFDGATTEALRGD